MLFLFKFLKWFKKWRFSFNFARNGPIISNLLKMAKYSAVRMMILQSAGWLTISSIFLQSSKEPRSLEFCFFPQAVTKKRVSFCQTNMPHFMKGESFSIQEIMLEVRLSHYWYDSRLETNFKKPIELVPEAIGEFWSPDSYFHHAKDSKTVNLIRKPASLRITPDKMIKYTMM